MFFGKLAWMSALALAPQTDALQPALLRGRQHQQSPLGLELPSRHPQQAEPPWSPWSPPPPVPSDTVRVDLEIGAPVVVSAATACTTQVLMRHTFAQSYGIPFTANYTPPDRDECDFNRVVINFTATSRGRQYDRLAFMFLTDIEVWRTSTAEPTRAGIVWSHVRDMTAYMVLWNQPQTLVFELDNNVDETYTGLYHTTLPASFYRDADPPVVADAILPISTQSGAERKQSVFRLPEQRAWTYHSIPRNVTRAAVSIAANGQIMEEFWYTNVFSSQAMTFNSTAGPLPPGGPFREIQLRIDGHCAGLVWPFPVIFTGGFVPALWSPVVGIQAFDLVESEIDITPFLPYLMDGRPHRFEINVLQLSDEGGNGRADLERVEDYWLVTGKVFLFYGDGASCAGETGGNTLPVISGKAKELTISSNVTTYQNGTNATLSYNTKAVRHFSSSSPAGSWEQRLEFNNAGLVTAGGFHQSNVQITRGWQSSKNTVDPRFDQRLTFE